MIVIVIVYLKRLVQSPAPHDGEPLQMLRICQCSFSTRAIDFQSWSNFGDHYYKMLPAVPVPVRPAIGAGAEVEAEEVVGVARRLQVVV